MMASFASIDDYAIAELMEELRALPGIKRVSGSCYQGRQNLRIFFDMDSTSVGACILARCMSGRYSSYAENESRYDMEWVIKMGDSDAIPSFELTGPRMCIAPEKKDYRIEKLIKNIRYWKTRSFFKDSSRNARATFNLESLEDIMEEALE